MHDSQSSHPNTETFIGNETHLIGSRKGRPAGSPVDEHQPELWRLAGAMSMINLALFVAWLYHQTTSLLPFGAGLIVGILLAFALSGRPVASVIRRVTHWQQSLCYPLGILLGNVLGFVGGGAFALYLS